MANYKVLHGAVGRFAQGDVVSTEQFGGADVVKRLLGLQAIEKTDDQPVVAAEAAALSGDDTPEAREQQAEIRAVTVGDGNAARAEADIKRARKAGDDPKATEAERK